MDSSFLHGQGVFRALGSQSCNLKQTRQYPGKTPSLNFKRALSSKRTYTGVRFFLKRERGKSFFRALFEPPLNLFIGALRFLRPCLAGLKKSESPTEKFQKGEILKKTGYCLVCLRLHPRALKTPWPWRKRGLKLSPWPGSF